MRVIDTSGLLADIADDALRLAKATGKNKLWTTICLYRKVIFGTVADTLNGLYALSIVFYAVLFLYLVYYHVEPPQIWCVIMGVCLCISGLLYLVHVYERCKIVHSGLSYNPLYVYASIVTYNAWTHNRQIADMMTLDQRIRLALGAGFYIREDDLMKIKQGDELERIHIMLRSTIYGGRATGVFEMNDRFKKLASEMQDSNTAQIQFYSKDGELDDKHDNGYKYYTFGYLAEENK